MAELKVPKSRQDKSREKALKVYEDYQRLLSEGNEPWQSKKAIVKKYKIAMTTVYNRLKLAEELLRKEAD